MCHMFLQSRGLPFTAQMDPGSLQKGRARESGDGSPPVGSRGKAPVGVWGRCPPVAETKCEISVYNF